MNPIDLSKMLETAGPVAVLIAFFIWRDYKRELTMTARLQYYEDFLRTELVGLIKTTSDAIIASTTTRLATIQILKELRNKTNPDALRDEGVVLK